MFSVLNNEEECPTDVHSPAAIIGALRERRWVITQEEQVSRYLRSRLIKHWAGNKLGGD